eukprot:3426397-Prymnesium_polylepis.1
MLRVHCKESQNPLVRGGAFAFVFLSHDVPRPQIAVIPLPQQFVRKIRLVLEAAQLQSHVRTIHVYSAEDQWPSQGAILQVDQNRNTARDATPERSITSMLIVA